ncbi:MULTISPECIES: IclR family transcriptional regulator [Haloferax]|uniref:Helix-turn-helix domain-containing protein n=1 Tax=Haloferax marinum TaxID=2666143 RepID=A0A6A8GAV7_9EURY|nr:MULTISPECIES: IclR family transcriptional regulator [Haloferax]KAB1191248.1 IclR family transcriptional regulator [Haloferax sp. CBA1150]MRW98141.1 helix-turn-helix domain-containing protein [Haloferax marinum]
MANEKVTTTERSLEILAVIKEREGASLSMLADELPLSRSTIHKHLTTLADHGFVDKEGERYSLGMKFLNFGVHARSRRVEHVLAAETVQQLAAETEEEVDLVVENDGRGIVVHESYHPHSHYGKQISEGHGTVNTGAYYHLHSIAAGKAILAELPDERVSSIIEKWGLPKRTRRTLTTESALREELETIRAEGISFSDQEYADGMRAVGRRVRNPNGSLVGSISITAPAYRMTDEVYNERIPRLLTEYIDELESKIEDAYPSV